MFWFYIDPCNELATLIKKAIGHPTLLAFLCCIAVCLAVALTKASRRAKPWVHHLIFASFLGITAYYMTTAVLYLRTDGFLDHLEPGVAVSARIVSQGHQLYHAAESAERYNVMYGPMLYITNLCFQMLFRDIIFASKLCGVFLGICSLLLMYLTFIKHAGRTLAALQTAVMILFYACFGHYSYWNKSESLLLFCASVACCTLFISRHSMAAIILGCATAVAINTKLHAVLYLAPFWIYFRMYRGGAFLLPCCVTTAICIALPFGFFESVSLYNYLQHLQVAGRHPLFPPLFFLNIQYALVLFLPVIFFAYLSGKAPLQRGSSRWKNPVIISALVLPMFLACIAGSKIGAGPHHLLPFAPAIIFIVWLAHRGTDQPRSRRALNVFFVPLVLLWLLVAGVVAFSSQKTIMPFLLHDKGDGPHNELKHLKAQYSSLTMQMGYGDDSFEAYTHTWFRPLLYETKNDYLLDAPAIMDMKLAGIGIPPATFHALETQKYDIWLIPGNGAPFTMRTWYPPADSLFGEMFNTVFEANYRKIETLQYYSLWMANRLRG